MDEQLIDYALDQLTAPERADVERLLASDPAAARKLALLQARLAPLGAERAVAVARPGLALAAIATVAQYIADHPLGEAEPLATPRTWANDRPVFSSRPRADILVAACLAFVFVGLLLPGVQKYRSRAQTAACQENLHELHTALAGYSDLHDGRFPQAGAPGVPTAGYFVAELTRSGQYPANGKPFCPTETVPADAVGYAYSLGYHGRFGELVGPRLPDPEASTDLLPISADLPTGTAHGGWNVLAAGGSVRFTTSAKLGGGDDIFANDAGQRRAGLHRNDVSLGRPFDMP